MVAGCCVYARVGCQQNPLIVPSQSKRIESYAGIRHTLQLSMLFGGRVCDTLQTVYGFVTAWFATRRKLPVGFTTLLQQLGFVGIVDIFDYYFHGFGSGVPD
jgi:hypothetical protein